MKLLKSLKASALVPVIGLLFATIPLTAFSLTYPPYPAHAGYMGGHMGYGGGWIMAVIVILLLVDLVLGAAALIKFLLGK